MSYRVAVIENESESLRYGYANIVPRLAQIKRLKNYTFERFDNQNLDLLFENDRILSFDSLFISTNATSDGTTLATLRKNQLIIEKFITLGKGLFVSNQKKLAISSETAELNQTGFLPTDFEIAAIERPELSSSEGKVVTTIDINLPADPVDIILNFPEKILSDEVLRECRENDFKPHIYRAYLHPMIEGAYHTLLLDNSYDDKLRPLLIVNRQSGASERIIISTIAIDWEWHVKLITNIIVFISEGFPTVAFISGPTNATGDFQYLVSSASLSKIPHSVYPNIDSIPNRLLEAHGIYVLSSDCTDEQANQLWRELVTVDSTRYGRKRYRRMYRLHNDNQSLSLIQHTNYNSIDLAVDSAVSWIDRQYSSGMWGGSFWSTYDVLSMMAALEIDIHEYLGGVFEDIKNHYKAGSYDGVLGATCGLLELGVNLTRIDQDAMKNVGFDEEILQKSANWIIDCFANLSASGKQTSILALYQYATWAAEHNIVWVARPKYETLFSAARRELAVVTASSLASGHSELDILRSIKVAVVIGTAPEEIENLFKKLRALQSLDGYWRSAGRTAYVVISLIQNYHPLVQALEGDADLNEVIYNAILYLRATRDQSTGTWGKDIQTTAKAAQALGMHNKLFAHSTQDIFETIRHEVSEIDRSEGIREMRRELSQLREATDKSRREAKKAEHLYQRAQQDAARALLSNNIYAKKSFKWRLIGTVSSMLLLGLIISLGLSQRAAAVAIFSEIGSALPLILGAVISIPLTFVTSPPTNNTND
jgi:hypothetical protein